MNNLHRILIRTRIQFSRTPINALCNPPWNPHFAHLRRFSIHSCSRFLLFPQIQSCRAPNFSKFRMNFYSGKPPSRSFRRRRSKRLKAAMEPKLNETLFQEVISQIPPRFTPQELYNAMSLQDDPLVCFELFNWASQQHRFRHDESTYRITIQKLGVAKMYDRMDIVVNQVLALSSIGSEALYNSIIYFYTENRKLSKAVDILNHMRNRRNLSCRPSLRTYNLLFTAFLSRHRNPYVNHVFMETLRSLFRHMLNDGVEPDTYILNCMIKGYVLSFHLNDALRIFHQMGAVYSCLPNSYSYDCLIHGLCAQGRTNNARQLCNEMKEKGFVPSNVSYNSLVNAMALNGEVQEAVNYLWEMIGYRRYPDFITYRTLLDEMCRKGWEGEATKLLREFQEKDLVDGYTFRKLHCVLEDDHRNLY